MVAVHLSPGWQNSRSRCSNCRSVRLWKYVLSRKAVLFRTSLIDTITMKSLYFIRTLVLGALTCCLALLALGNEPAPGRPNIVLIIADDHDNEHLGFMGNTTVRAPNLDRLARQGTVFTTFHLTASLCRPSLASLLFFFRIITP